MKKHRNRYLWLISFMVALLIPLVITLYLAWHFFIITPQTIEAKKRQLLYSIPHADVLAGCDFIQANRGKFRPDPNWSAPIPDYPDPTDPLIPSAICALKPVCITIDKNSVRLEFGGGFLHFGLEGYSPGIRGSGNVEIIPRLWFYTEEGKVPKP